MTEFIRFLAAIVAIGLSLGALAILLGILKKLFDWE